MTRATSSKPRTTERPMPARNPYCLAVSSPYDDELSASNCCVAPCGIWVVMNEYCIGRSDALDSDSVTPSGVRGKVP